MTPQEALAQALMSSTKVYGTVEEEAADILAALPDGWGLMTIKQDRALYEEGQAFGAQQERNRLRALVADDPEANSCTLELHQHQHEWCNGRAFLRIIGTG